MHPDRTLTGKIQKPMSASPPSLEELRREIDEIDDAIHDLLMRRAQVVEQVGIAKQPDNQIVRPGREAVILRRLAARHVGPFPLAVVVRIWREMISAFSRLQGPFAITVYAPEDKRGFWDVARDHYGSSIPMTAVNTPAGGDPHRGRRHRHRRRRADAGRGRPRSLVALPHERRRQDAPRIVARLPFCGRGNARGDDRDALAIALIAA